MEHTASFHLAFKRMCFVAEGFDLDLDNEQILTGAPLQGISERDARLAIQLLPEACGYVFASKLGIILPDEYHLEELGKITPVCIELDDDFQAALSLAHHLSQNGQDELFRTLMYPSSILGSIEEILSMETSGKASQNIKFIMISI